jgi:uncharacterized protein YbaR (Trm112 family)
MHFTCPFCKVINNVDDDQQESKITCRKCAKQFRVPDHQKVPDERIQKERKIKAKPSDVPRPEQRESTRQPKIAQPAKRGVGLFLRQGTGWNEKSVCGTQPTGDFCAGCH